MRKLIFFICFVLTGLIASAGEILSLTKAFDGRYNYKKGVNITEIRQPNNYYYSISVDKDIDIISQLEKWVSEAEKSSVSVNTSISGSVKKIVLMVPSENEYIYIVMEINRDKTKIDVWMQSINPIPGLEK